MNDFITSLIRTNVPVVVGGVVAWLITLGIEVPEGSEGPLIAALTAAAIAVYYVTVRALETRWPGFGFLLGTRAEPSYPEHIADGPGKRRAEPTE